MTRKFITDFRAGDPVHEVFYVKAAKAINFRQKEGSFLSLQLTDRTGSIEAKMWQYDPGRHSLAVKIFARCRGEVVEFNGARELHLQEVEPVDRATVTVEDFLAQSPVAREVLQQDFAALSATVTDPNLKQLLANFQQDPELFPRFCAAPAAKLVHQAYLGGLVEHSLQAARIVTAVASLYPAVNRDLALTGALLHDLGKIAEYEWDYAIEVSDEGRLLGHIVAGLRLLDTLMAYIPGFPEDLALGLRHILTSHHGEYEHQSPRRPKTIEACLVHYADELEAQLWKFSDLQERYKGERWSPWEKTLGRFVFVG